MLTLYYIKLTREIFNSLPFGYTYCNLEPRLP